MSGEDILRDLYDDEEIDKTLHAFTEDELDAEEEAIEAADTDAEPPDVEVASEPEVVAETAEDAAPETVTADAAEGSPTTDPEPEATESVAVDWKAQHDELKEAMLARVGALQERTARAEAEARLAKAQGPAVAPGGDFMGGPEKMPLPDNTFDYGKDGEVVLDRVALARELGIQADAQPAPPAPPGQQAPAPAYSDHDVRLAKAETRSMLMAEGSGETILKAEEAFQDLAGMVVEAQRLEGASGVIADPTDAYRFIEARGIGELWRSKHGDVSPTRAEMIDLLEFGMTGDLSAGRRVAGSVKARTTAEETPAQASGVAAPQPVTRPASGSFGKTDAREEYTPDDEVAAEEALDFNQWFEKSDEAKRRASEIARKRTAT